MGTQGPGRKRIPNREKLTAEDDALNQIAREVRLLFDPVIDMIIDLIWRRYEATVQCVTLRRIRQLQIFPVSLNSSVMLRQIGPETPVCGGGGQVTVHETCIDSKW